MRTLLTGVGGAVLVVAGIVMLVVPGPGIVTIVAGLALLARRFNWANRVLVWARRRLPDRIARSRPAARLVRDDEDDHADDDPVVPAA